MAKAVGWREGGKGGVGCVLRCVLRYMLVCLCVLVGGC